MAFYMVSRRMQKGSMKCDSYESTTILKKNKHIALKRSNFFVGLLFLSHSLSSGVR